MVDRGYQAAAHGGATAAARRGRPQEASLAGRARRDHHRGGGRRALAARVPLRPRRASGARAARAASRPGTGSPTAPAATATAITENGGLVIELDGKQLPPRRARAARTSDATTRPRPAGSTLRYGWDDVTRDGCETRRRRPRALATAAGPVSSKPCSPGLPRRAGPKATLTASQQLVARTSACPSGRAAPRARPPRSGRRPSRSRSPPPRPAPRRPAPPRCPAACHRSPPSPRRERRGGPPVHGRRAPPRHLHQLGPVLVVVAVGADAQVKPVAQPERGELDLGHRPDVAGQHRLVRVPVQPAEHRRRARAAPARAPRPRPAPAGPARSGPR